MSCKRIAEVFAILLLSAVAFGHLYMCSTMEGSTLNAFQLMMPIEPGTYQFYHDFEGRRSDISQGQHALSFRPSQKITNEAIVANGKSYRSILEGALDYKPIDIKTGKLVLTKRINQSKSFSALARLIVSDASGRVAAKRFMQFLPNSLTNDLILTATKGEI